MSSALAADARRRGGPPRRPGPGFPGRGSRRRGGLGRGAPAPVRRRLARRAGGRAPEARRPPGGSLGRPAAQDDRDPPIGQRRDGDLASIAHARLECIVELGGEPDHRLLAGPRLTVAGRRPSRGLTSRPRSSTNTETLIGAETGSAVRFSTRNTPKPGRSPSASTTRVGGVIGTAAELETRPRRRARRATASSRSIGDHDRRQIEPDPAQATVVAAERADASSTSEGAAARFPGRSRGALVVDAVTLAVEVVIPVVDEVRTVLDRDLGAAVLRCARRHDRPAQVVPLTAIDPHDQLARLSAGVGRRDVERQDDDALLEGTEGERRRPIVAAAPAPVVVTSIVRPTMSVFVTSRRTTLLLPGQVRVVTLRAAAGPSTAAGSRSSSRSAGRRAAAPTRAGPGPVLRPVPASRRRPWRRPSAADDVGVLAVIPLSSRSRVLWKSAAWRRVCRP